MSNAYLTPTAAPGSSEPVESAVITLRRYFCETSSDHAPCLKRRRPSETELDLTSLYITTPNDAHPLTPDGMSGPYKPDESAVTTAMRIVQEGFSDYVPSSKRRRLSEAEFDLTSPHLAMPNDEYLTPDGVIDLSKPAESAAVAMMRMFYESSSALWDGSLPSKRGCSADADESVCNDDEPDFNDGDDDDNDDDDNDNGEFSLSSPPSPVAASSWTCQLPFHPRPEIPRAIGQTAASGSKDEGYYSATDSASVSSKAEGEADGTSIKPKL